MEGIATRIRKIEPSRIVLLVGEASSVLIFPFVPLFLMDGGLRPFQILLAYAALRLSTVVASCARKSISQRQSVVASFAAVFALLLLFVAFEGQALLLAGAFALLFTLRNVFLFLPLNHMFFEKAARRANGESSFTYMAVWSVLEMATAPLAALVIASFGYRPLFTFAAIACIPLALAARGKTQERKLKVDIAGAAAKSGSLMPIWLLEGLMDQFGSIILPVYALFFISSSLEFGGLLAYLAMLSLVASYLLARHSDRLQKRLPYIRQICLLAGLAAFGLGLAGSLAAWVVLAGIFAVLDNLSYPIRLAVQVDRKSHGMGFWAVREAGLNAGRFIGIAASAALFFMGLHWVVFAAYGAVYVAYPFVMKRRLGIE